METVFNEATNLHCKCLFLPSGYNGVCFSKNSRFYYKWQWWSLWRNLFLSPCYGSLFLVKLQVFIGSDGVCDRSCFYLHLWYLDFIKASGPHNKWQRWSLWQSLFSFSCCDSLLLLKLQVFTINNSDWVCDGACFYPHAVLVSF